MFQRINKFACFTLFCCLFMSSASFASSTPNPASNTPSNSDPLIPRAILFGDPEFIQVRLSADGKHMSYLGPSNGVLNVWVGDYNKKESMRPITQNKERGIADYFWAYNNEHIIFFDDNKGSEDWRIYSADIKTGELKTLASFKKVQARVVAVSRNFPDEILIGLNQRREDLHDIYRLNVRTAALTPVYENNEFLDFVVDDNYNVRLGVITDPDGGRTVYTLDDKFNKTKLFKINYEDSFATEPLSLNKTGEILYLLDNRGRDTAALTALNLKTQKLEVIGEDSRADMSDAILHPTEKTIQGYASTYERIKWTIIDKTIQPDIDYLNKLHKGDLTITSRSLDDKHWIVAYLQDNSSHQYYAYDRQARHATYLFASKPKLDNQPLTTMEPVIIQSRDNLPLVSYLSLPRFITAQGLKGKMPVPLVMYVHGGPNYIRDDWGYSGTHQWLANRGYAVLSVNYRGSAGFGKKFVTASNGEWGAKMHDDILDAVNWAIKQGITTPDKVAIMGGSYGGYETLVGMTMTPEVFACGIDIVGMSSLATMMKTIPAYWKPFYALMKIKIGADPDTEEGLKFLASRSPLSFVENIKKPLLIGQGANDPRVKQEESEQIVSAMVAKNIPIIYILYPDEGHGFARPENRLSFYTNAEAFLARCLGGKLEPLGKDFENSSIEIKNGKDYLDNLLGLK